MTTQVGGVPPWGADDTPVVSLQVGATFVEFEDGPLLEVVLQDEANDKTEAQVVEPRETQYYTGETISYQGDARETNVHPDW